MRILDILLGIVIIIMSIAMVCVAWYFFFQEETAIIQIASLYVALFISVCVFVLGILNFYKKGKSEEDDEEEKPKIVKLPTTDEGLKDYIPSNKQKQPLSKPQQEYCTIAIDEAKIIPEDKEQDNHWERDFEIFKTIKQCIELLSTDGKGTKQQVKEKLEELLKDD